MDQPGARGDNAEESSNGRELDDGAGSLIVVNVVALREAKYHPTRFVVSKCAVRVGLMLEDPHAC